VEATRGNSNRIAHRILSHPFTMIFRLRETACKNMRSVAAGQAPDEIHDRYALIVAGQPVMIQSYRFCGSGANRARMHSHSITTVNLCAQWLNWSTPICSRPAA
jgi:hypothetical protein